jgi:hypothetical protein
LLPFLLNSFGPAWGILLLFILFQDLLTAIFCAPSARHPPFIPALCGPAIAAIIVVLRHAGTAGLRRYASRLLLRRCSLGWYAVLIVGIPLVFLGGALLNGHLGEDPRPFSGAGSMLAATAFMLALGPVEEIGTPRPTIDSSQEDPFQGTSGDITAPVTRLDKVAHITRPDR